MKKRVWIGLLVLFLVALLATGQLLYPKYMDKPYEGALTGEYYDNAGYSDLMIIGDCEVYENISPVTLWRDWGISSYIRGSAQQLVWQSYYLLEDALRLETPKVVLFSVLAMMYDKPQNEAYNRLTLDGMRFTRTKWDAIQASKTPEESVASYYWPLLRFHERWQDIKKEDFQYYFTRRQVGINGFMMRSDILPVGWIREPDRQQNYQFGDNAYAYLDKITALCKEKGIQLVLFKAPSLSPPWFDEWDAQMVDYAKKHDLLYINALAEQKTIGLDFAVDTYDAGLHLNRQGAEKMAHYLGEVLTRESALPDRRDDPAYTAAWQPKLAAYDAMRDAQEKEIQESGAVQTFLVPEVD
ncbi:MAG: SGNH/GDSL hydrolase family protein [Oscillospiraceae bacterium]|jgi:hypothetical protein|nr:SGNH/GDSL hydrolase family protein [Oscillospiraceae bacterium]